MNTLKKKINKPNRLKGKNEIIIHEDEKILEIDSNLLD